MRTHYLDTVYKTPFFCSIFQNPKYINYSIFKNASKNKFEYYSILVFIFYIEYKQKKKQFNSIVEEFKQKSKDENKNKNDKNDSKREEKNETTTETKDDVETENEDENENADENENENEDENENENENENEDENGDTYTIRDEDKDVVEEKDGNEKKDEPKNKNGNEEKDEPKNKDETEKKEEPKNKNGTEEKEEPKNKDGNDEKGKNNDNDDINDDINNKDDQQTNAMYEDPISFQLISISNTNTDSCPPPKPKPKPKPRMSFEETKQTHNTIKKKIHKFSKNKLKYKKKFIKKLFNKICVKSHPDKTNNDPFKQYLFVKTKKAYKNKNMYKLILIANILQIKISDRYFNSNIDKYIVNELQLLNEKTNEFRLYI